MPTSLALTIDGNRIGLSGLGQAVVDFSELLAELDATLSSDGEVAQWDLTAISYASPLRILATAIPSKSGADRGAEVAEVCIAGARALTASPQRPPGFNDHALQRIGQLSELTTQGIDTIRIADGTLGGQAAHNAAQEAVLTSATATNAAAVLAETTDIAPATVEPSDYGSVEGPAEAFNVHAAPFFTVWDAITGRAVQCFFDEADREHIADIVAKRRTVSVSGSLRRNPDGSPVRIRPVDAIQIIDEPLPGAWVPPAGLFGGVGDTQEYLRSVRGD